MSKNKTIKRILGAWSAVLVLVLLTFFAVSCTGRDKEPSEPSLSVESRNDAHETVNVLVMGADRTSGLYDVLMLVHVDLTVPSATVLQIPRDTYASYTESAYRKLNGAARALGGEEAFCSFLSESFGIAVDRYVLLDADVLAEVVDTVGGVEIMLPDALHYEDPAQSLTIDLPAGEQTLDGRTAEYFVRYRMGYVRGDLGRMDAQKLFLASLAKKVKSSMSITTSLKLVATLLPRIKTNLTLFECSDLLRALYAMDEENVWMLTLPGEEAIAKKSGASYYAVSAPAAGEVLTRYFGAPTASFDRERRFCNTRYPSFCEIYDSYRPYTVYSMGEIVEDGIEIEKTSG